MPITLSIGQADSASINPGNFPNPFNPETNIFFTLPHSARVELAIYNVLGQRVITLIDDYLDAGKHQVVWRGTDSQGRELTSGVYFYRLDVGGAVQTKKMLLLR